MWLPCVQSWPCDFDHETTSQSIKPKSVPGKTGPIGSVPVNPGNRTKLRAWSWALSSDLEVHMATSGEKSSLQPMLPQLLTAQAFILFWFHPFLAPSFFKPTFHILRPCFKTSLVPDQLPPLYVYLDVAPCTGAGPGGGGMSKRPTLGRRAHLCLHWCCRPQGLDVLCSPAFPKPPHPLAKHLIYGSTNFVKHTSTNDSKFTLICYIPYPPTFTNLILQVWWPCLTDIQAFWF